MERVDKRQGSTREATAAALGITRQTLWQHERQGRVVMFPDRSVDVEATRIRIATMKSNAGGKREEFETPAPAPASAQALDNNEAAILLAIPPELAFMDPMEVERRRKVAVMQKAEADARSAKANADEAEKRSVPADRSDKAIFEAGMVTRQSFESDAESSCNDLHALFGAPLMEARLWLIERDRKVLTRIADALASR